MGGRHAGVAAGVLNTAASAGAAVAGWMSGEVLQYYLDGRASALGIPAESLKEREFAPDRAAALVAGYETNLLIFAAVTAVAALVWLGSNAERPVRANDD